MAWFLNVREEEEVDGSKGADRWLGLAVHFLG
jgi:hypothetical protein